jgi:hypothetical protein
MKNFKSLVCVILFPICSFYATEYHVAKTGKDTNEGTEKQPFLTISEAVKHAKAGDIITVHKGVYREKINPLNGGESDSKRIIYRANPGEKVEIKGSEEIKNWVKQKNGLWKVVIKNTFFKDYNPYSDLIFGDWFWDQGRIHHTGEVFLNGKSLYEKETFDQLLTPKKLNPKDMEGSKYTWFCETNKEETTIWANFQKSNPNKEFVEISTRNTCFYPEKPGLNYITIKGFHFSQAATQWGAPTAEQVGMIATHWNKGWIIEDNIISDSKCSGITLGKEKGTGHNVWSADKANVHNDGNIHYIEVVFKVLRNGWTKENIGSHIIRNNTIYNCEQTGICGSMGAVFSTIENNHIYNIWSKRQFDGAEIAGIKFHAAIDVTLRKNRVHNCGRGIWLDWMAQNARVSQSLLYDNDVNDLFIEVNHGPLMIDNNILLSTNTFKNQSEGTAFINNLIGGSVYVWPDKERFTPYFVPHTIDMAGLSIILSGDERYYNNVFIGTDIKNPENFKNGLEGITNQRFDSWIENNVYYKGAKPSAKDKSFVQVNHNPNIKLTEEGANVFLSFNVEEKLLSHKIKIIDTENLGVARVPKGKFENPDATQYAVDFDYFGNKRTSENNIIGPILNLKAENKIKVW